MLMLFNQEIRIVAVYFFEIFNRRQIKHGQYSAFFNHIFYVCGQNSDKIMIKKGLTHLVILFLYLISLLPFWLLYFISDILFVIIYYVVGYRRKEVQQNLQNAF